MLVDFNDWDSELVQMVRSIERFASRLNLEPVYDSHKLEKFIATRNCFVVQVETAGSVHKIEQV